MSKMIPKKLKLKRGRGRSRHTGACMNYILCKTVVAIVILEGLSGGGLGSIPTTAKAEEVNYSNITSSQYYQQQRQSGYRGSNFGSSGDSFISTFNRNNEVDATKRMRDHCGRYSLLKVLQQWENLQKRCRLGIRNNNFDRRYGRRYEYDTDTANNNGMLNLSETTDDEEIREEKRSRRPHYYRAPTVHNSGYNYYDMNGDMLESCCPTVFEIVTPTYGRNRSGLMVELFQDATVHQEFPEYRCHEDYLDRPCRYVDNRHRKISRCVQQHLHTYALVRTDQSQTGWSMQHIKIKSGCACKIDPVKAAAAASRRRKKLPSLSSSRSQIGSLFPDFFLNKRNTRDKGNDERSLFQQFRSRNSDY